jgi:beta-mannosidase
MLLSDGWVAAEADDELRRVYHEERFDDRGWAAIAVPGHWRSQGPFGASDGSLLHRCRFAAPRPGAGRRAWLTFHGLFYQGDHWLDGSYLGDTEGYFQPHTFEVTDQLRRQGSGGEPVDHVLASEVTCAPPGDRRHKRNITGVFQDWDCLDPDWNPGGIWRPVELTETGPVRIAQLRVLCRDAGPERATVALRAVLSSDAARSVRLHTVVENTVGSKLGSPGGEQIDQVVERSLAAGDNTLDWTVTVERPALWWPRALGDPVLHDVRVSVDLPDGPDGPDGTTSDRRVVRTGLRAVRWRNWVCSVNGERLFLKGSNLGPTRMALADATPDEVRRDVQLAADAGLDLLRVHAHVARPELYDAADEAGLLLWQDFPLQWGYARGIRRQAVRQAQAAVDLLGHHPSIALWCAHNDPHGPASDRAHEITTGDLARIAAAQQVPSWNKTVLDRSVKRAIERADGTRPVVAHSGVLPHPPRFDGTDSHLYFGWHWGSERQLARFARLIPRMVRFVSELGAQAVPAGDGAAFLEPERWPDLDWERLAHTHGLQREAFDRYVPPADHPTFESWQAATQRYQARLLKHQIETLRRLKYRPTGGFAQFLLADAHPAVSWSVLDHERRPKPGYAALRDACRPVIVVADRLPEALRPGDALALDMHVVSDRRAPVAGAEVTAKLAWSGGDHAWRWAGDVPADSVTKVGTLQVVTPDAPGPLVLALELRLPDGELVTNRDESHVTPAGDAGP